MPGGPYLAGPPQSESTSGDSLPVRRISEGVVATVRGLRADELLRRIIDVDPELLLPYLLDRRGRSQDLLATALAGLVREGQRQGSIRDGDADLIARRLAPVLAGMGVFRYGDDSDALLGVAPWLPALYFAFGVVVAVLAEIAAKDRQPSVRSSASGTPAPH